MRSGVLSDSYLEEFCKEFRPVPLAKVGLLKIDHPQNPYSGIKPIYNQTIVRPESINTMVANIHRTTPTVSHDVLLENSVQDVIDPITSEVFERTGEVITGETVDDLLAEVVGEVLSESPRRGGARAGAGRMPAEFRGIKEMAQLDLQFKEKISKKDVAEAMRYAGGERNEAISRIVSDKKQQAVKDVIDVILKKVEKQKAEKKM